MIVMKEIECPSCSEMIPGDSLYCDMCGVKLLECINCGTVGCDEFCPECGKPMVSRKSVKVKTKAGGSTDGDDGFTTTGKRPKKMILKSRNGDVTLQPENEAIIGRKESPYAEALSSLNLISRRHGKFVKRGRDWYIVDFGSTNGTYVNDSEVPPNMPVKFSVGDAIDIGTYIFDVVEVCED